MTASLELRDLLKQALTLDESKAYPSEASKNATYPYSVFTVKITDPSSVPVVGILEVNVWDMQNTYSRANSIMDAIEKKTEVRHTNEKMMAWMYKGQRDEVPDENKDIKRVREQFEIRFAERN